MLRRATSFAISALPLALLLGAGGWWAIEQTTHADEGHVGALLAGTRSQQENPSSSAPELRGMGAAPEESTARKEAATPRRMGGRVLLRAAGGSTPARGIEVHVTCQTFFQRMGWGMRATCFEATLKTDGDGTFGMDEPAKTSWTRGQRGSAVTDAYLTVKTPEGYVSPPPLKLYEGRVFAALEIPTRVYRNDAWVSVPEPRMDAWPQDASHAWALPTLVLEPALTLRGVTQDPEGLALPHAHVSCAWSYRGLGEQRIDTVSDGRGAFTFDVPATAEQVHLRLHLRPGKVEGCDGCKGGPRSYPWPGTPELRVTPGASEVVLQGHATAGITGQLVTASGEELRAGTFDVWPVPPTRWPIGYRHASERSYRVERNDDGTFRIDGLRAGRWIVQFQEASSEAQAPQMGYAIVEAPADDVHIVCRPASELAWTPVGVRSTSPRDRRRRLNRVQFLQPVGPTKRASWWQDATTVALPRFAARVRSGVRDHLPHGWRVKEPGVLFVSRDDGLCALVQDVVPGAESVEAALVPGGTIAGRIADYDLLGFLENGERIHVEARRGHLVRRAPVERTGRFRIPGLPHGRWNVHVVAEHVWADNPRTWQRNVPTDTKHLVLYAR